MNPPSNQLSERLRVLEYTRSAAVCAVVSLLFFFYDTHQILMKNIDSDEKKIKTTTINFMYTSDDDMKVERKMYKEKMYVSFCFFFLHETGSGLPAGRASSSSRMGRPCNTRPRR